MKTDASPSLRRGLIRFTSGGAILCFHSLTSAQSPSEGLVNLPLRSFARLTRAVKQVASIVPLAELIETHARGRSTGGAVALTFDDAYASLASSLELIRGERLPLTVFVTTRAAETGARYWWDRTEDLFPRVSRERWRGFEEEIGLPEAYRRGQPAEFGPLRPLRQWILAEFRGRWPADFELPLTRLESETGFQSLHRSMTFEELMEFATEPLVEFGVHTVTHPVLPLLSPAEFEDEVGGALATLEARLPRVRPILAIPYGLYDAKTAGLAHDAGMIASLTLAGRTLQGYQPDEGLPRFCLTFREPRWKLVLRVTGAAERFFGGRLERGRVYPDLPSPTT